MLLVALSCLQGRPMARAFADLVALPVDGIQLTPGCHPTPGFAPTGLTRTHHGFSLRAFRTRAVWADDGARLPEVPVILECYFHELTRDQRLAQLDLVRS